MFASDSLEDCFYQALVFNSQTNAQKPEIDEMKAEMHQIESLYTENNKYFKREWATSEVRQTWRQAVDRTETIEELALLLIQLDNGMSSPSIN